MRNALVFAFTAGAVATVNPCGFALLPAWFSRQLAGREGDGPGRRFLRAVVNGGAATLGFVIVFALAAAILQSGANWLGTALPYVGATIGGTLVALGLVWLLGLRSPPIPFFNTCRRANERYGAFGFGLSYGFISLSCILPVFMGVAGVSFLGNHDIAYLGIVAFVAGTGAVLAIIAAVAAIAGAGVFTALGSRYGLLRRISGGLTVLAGAYVFIYWGQILFEPSGWMRAVLDEGSYKAAEVNQWLSSGMGPSMLLAAFLLVLMATWVIWVAMMRGHKTSDGQQE